MLSALAVSGYTLPIPPLGLAPRAKANRAKSDIRVRLADLSKAQAKARIKLKEQRDRFDALLNQAAKLATDPDELQELAEAVRACESEAAAVLLPQITKLRRDLARPMGDAVGPVAWRRLAEESLEIGITWLELYQNLQIQLHKRASDLRAVGEAGSGVLSTADAIDEHLRRLMSE